MKTTRLQWRGPIAAPQSSLASLVIAIFLWWIFSVHGHGIDCRGSRGILRGTKCAVAYVVRRTAGFRTAKPIQAKNFAMRLQIDNTDANGTRNKPAKRSWKTQKSEKLHEGKKGG